MSHAPTNTKELGFCCLLVLARSFTSPLLPTRPAPGPGFAGLGWPPRGPQGIFAHASAFRARRERSKVPYIVRQCIEEVEKRGIEEVGIYRISGVATDIQALKAVFDASECPGGRPPFTSRSPGRVHRH